CADGDGLPGRHGTGGAGASRVGGQRPLLSAHPHYSRREAHDARRGGMIDSPLTTQAAAAPEAASQPLPPTSLIIPSRGRPELLLATVQSILAGDEVP